MVNIIDGGLIKTTALTTAPVGAAMMEHAASQPLGNPALLCPLEWAKYYIGRDFSPIPIAFKEKGPKLPNWQNTRINLENVEQFFSIGPGNIGIVLGSASGGLVDIDLDCPEAVLLAPRFLPDTGMVFGRESKQASHWLYKIAEPGKTVRYEDPVTGETLLEYRADGGQTVFPGSVHQSGEPIRFVTDADPAPASRVDLIERLSRLAAASLFADYWPNGSRHFAALALAGWLLKSGWAQEDVHEFMGAVCDAARDEEKEDRLNTVMTTAERLAKGEPTQGSSGIADLFDRRIITKVSRWLNIELGKKIVSSRTNNELLTVESVTPYTDMANAERYAHEHQNRAKYCHSSKVWYIWGDQRWSPDKTGEVDRLAMGTVLSMTHRAMDERDRDALDWAKRSQQDQRLSAMVRLAAKFNYVEPEQFDCDSWRYNCLSGTIDLRTGRLLPHNPADLNSKLARVRFAAEASCPTWLAFLDRVTDGNQELIGFLQRAIGYTLTGSTAEQCLFVMIGNGANGKSTFINTIAALLGEYTKQTPMDTLMVQKHGTIPCDLAELAGARFVAATEAETGQQLAEAKIKAMTGGDPITARFLYGRYFTFEPQFKLWLATNHLPDIKGVEEGIWRRIRIIPFTVSIPPEDRDPNLGAKLKAELPGILNWALQGCLQWQQEGLRPPDDVLMATTKYRVNMDILASFIEDCCRMEKGVKVSKKDLFNAYSDWCERNGEKAMPMRVIGQQLAERGWKDAKSGKTRYWSGVRLTELEDEFIE